MTVNELIEFLQNIPESDKNKEVFIALDDKDGHGIISIEYDDCAVFLVGVEEN